MSKFSGMALAVDKPSRMTIVHPATLQPIVNGDGEVAYVDVFSMDSELARKHRRSSTQVRIDQASKSGRARLNAGQLESEEVDILADLTAGWRLISLDGSDIDIECTAQNARDLYGDPGTAWLFEQVNEFARSRENFSKASLTT